MVPFARLSLPYLRPSAGQVRQVWRQILLCLALVVACSVVLSQASSADTFRSLHSFIGPENGAVPYAGMIQATDGNFYGTTLGGGPYSHGAVFRLTPQGTLTTLYSFAGPEGSGPWAALLQAKDGSLYGTTESGGQYNWGTIFRITLEGKLTTLHSFTRTEGIFVIAALLQAADGNFYGTTYEGGTAGEGTLFRITTAGTFTTLHNFTAHGSDGGYPSAALIQATDGSLYGTTQGGGPTNAGTLFRITTGGKYATLYSFDYFGADGTNPSSSLIQAKDGNLYGTTPGDDYLRPGTLYRITTGGKLTTLHIFPLASLQGSYPYASLLQARDGSLYGMTFEGGATGYGAVYRITTGGTFQTVYSFSANNGVGYEIDGIGPSASLIQSRDGNLYGTTAGGITPGDEGTVFRLTTAGAMTTLYRFTTTGKEGASPITALLQAKDGNLYGTTGYRDASRTSTIFQITPLGSLTTLYYFDSGGIDGYGPSSLIQATDGDLYGTTWRGGTYGQGTLFQTTTGGTFTSLHSFTDNRMDGTSPSTGLIQARDGNLYGTTDSGGANLAGTVFRFTPEGLLTTLYSFSGTDGTEPSARLIQARDGNLYGITVCGGPSDKGTIFRITTGGTLTTLHAFLGTEGANPASALIQANDDNLYGTTSYGGANNAGTIFRVTRGGTFTTLFSFGAVNSAGVNMEGSVPSALLQATDNNLYGTTWKGGAKGYGTVFQLTPRGKFTVLHTFTGMEGANPVAELIQARDGKLYGTTENGGIYGLGTIFSLEIARSTVSPVLIP